MNKEFLKSLIWELLFFRAIVSSPLSAKAEEFKSQKIFDMIKKALELDGKNLIQKVRGIYCFHVTKGPGDKESRWIVDAKNGSGSVTQGDGKLIKFVCLFIYLTLKWLVQFLYHYIHIITGLIYTDAIV